MTIERILQHGTLLLLLCVVSSSALRAQQGDTWDMNNVPVDDQELPYIGVGGGYLGMAAFINYDALNTVGQGLGLGTFSGPLFLHGGGGFTAIYLVKNFRLGVYGLGGSKEVSGNVTIDSATYKRTLRFGMGMTALQVDYAIPLGGSLTFFPGVMVGFNSYQLTAIQTHSDQVGFDSLFGPGGFTTNGTASPSALNRSTLISNSSVFLFPAVYLEYAVTKFILVRGGAGYGLSVLPSAWKTSDGVITDGVPDIKANGPMAQFGVFIGLFQ